MPVTKKERNEAKRMRTLNDINSIAEFGQVAGLTNADLDEDSDSLTPSKKRKAKKVSKICSIQINKSNLFCFEQQGKGKRKAKKKRKIRM